jgi:hypothetical protein
MGPAAVSGVVPKNVVFGTRTAKQRRTETPVSQLNLAGEEFAELSNRDMVVMRLHKLGIVIGSPSRQT